jgi:hypothetical protein
MLYDTVFAKTAAGVNELNASPSKLTPRQRRVLIMIDGKRTVGDLAPMMKEGEIDQMVANLIASQMIAVSGAQDLRSAPSVAEPSQPIVDSVAERMNEQRLPIARRRSIQIMEEAIGPGSESICLQLERAKGADFLINAEKCIAILNGLGKKSLAQSMRTEVVMQLI